ncbi:erythronate-4-phosphate dehydrogenase [hydrocarbon metagenome]|uniref:Erythronate-4-phosphate dehydrogenase n=1 Tax=hydrocarbon metagenome TaxID=938273 RepID=A0A0W8G087_9ZZZZ
MKIIVDENIEFGIEAFQQFGDVTLSHGRKITNEILKDVEVLIVRSITNVNEDLLKNTPVKFVGTTTIGTDHLDIDYLKSQKIHFASAPGCNSYAVTEYVLCAVVKIAHEKKINLTNKTLGVVGYGNIGKKITKFAEAVGLKTYVNDPPLQREGYEYNFCSLEEALNCDIITFHVPLNKTGIDKTFHLLDEQRINELKPGTILINTSRGGVVDNIALLKRLQNNNDITVVLDVWENEPIINSELLQKVYFGTPHIAGYSYEGKVNGTIMIYNSLCKFLNKEKFWKPVLKAVDSNKIDIAHTQNAKDLLYQITNKVYDIESDSNSLKSFRDNQEEKIGTHFDQLRKNYKLRREFNNYFVTSQNLTSEQAAILQSLRFNLF